MPHFSGRWGECHAFVGAMKIARTLPVSDRHDEWHPPFVGAMKIARNVPVSDRHVEWHHVVHFTIQPGTCETVGLRAIFIAPTKLRNRFLSPFIGVLAKPEGCGRFSSPLREEE